MAEGAHTEAPDDRRYYREHEWARLEDGTTAVIGITDYAAEELGEVVFVQLPAPGASVAQFERFGEIESVKAISELFSPVGGEVVAVNEDLLLRPELVNQSPFIEGWMLRIRLTEPGEMDKLMDAAAYRQYLEGLQ